MLGANAPAALMALTPCTQPCLLALPSGDINNGHIRVFDLGQSGQVMCEAQAHKSPVAHMAWAPDGRWDTHAPTP